MKTPLLLISFFFTLTSFAQITTPIIKAAFGVDADLKSNYFNGFVQSGNDDWYSPTSISGSSWILGTPNKAYLTPFQSYSPPNSWVTSPLNRSYSNQ